LVSYFFSSDVFSAYSWLHFTGAIRIFNHFSESAPAKGFVYGMIYYCQKKKVLYRRKFAKGVPEACDYEQIEMHLSGLYWY